MKFLTAIIIVAFVMLVSDRATAQTVSAATKSIESTYLCFNPEQMLPTAEMKDLSHYASLPRRYNTGGERAFVFSPRDREWAAYDANGYKVSGGIANGGKPGYRTPQGTYRSYSRMGPGHVSSKYDSAPMPYAMHFTKAGHAVHGSPYISNRNGSHGCIRVQTRAAQWLNQKFMTPGTKIIVLSY